MTIKQWLEGDCNYSVGLAIYQAQKRHSKNLLRIFNLKQNFSNEAKLKYELKKLLKFEQKLTIPVTIVKTITSQLIQPAFQPPKTYKTLRLNELPVTLHEMFIQQKNDFYRACSLKILLNDLPASSEIEALEYCLEIERLFDSIEKAWKIFDHYKKFKTVPEIPSIKNFEDLSPVLLLKAEKSKREAISKAKRMITNWTKKLQITTYTKDRDKLTRQLLNKNEALMGHEVALETIKKLINKK